MCYEHNGERYDTLTMAGCADCTVTGNSVISFNRERPVIRLGAGRDTGEKCRHNDVTLNKVLPSTGYEEELDQAAEIDGCSTLRIFGQIIVPLMMPAVATAAVFGFMHAAGAGLRNECALHVSVVVAPMPGSPASISVTSAPRRSGSSSCTAPTGRWSAWRAGYPWASAGISRAPRGSQGSRVPA